MESAPAPAAILAELQDACERAHIEYRDARQTLADVLGYENGADAGAVMILTMEFNTKPSITPAEPLGFLPALRSAIAAWQVLDHAVSRREDYLCATDPAHQRVRVQDGQEFVTAPDGTRTVIRDR
jgi:hypothetical protein